MQKGSVIETPVFIMGAGPSGAFAALKLNALGIPCTIVDKETFPRDKICGDAISGKVMINLKRLDPDLLERFHATTWKTGVWGIRFVAPNSTVLEVPFTQSYRPEDEVAPGFVARRVDFDNFLAQELKLHPLIQFHEQCAVQEYARVEGGFMIHCSNGQSYKTPMLLDASGAHSNFARKYAGLDKREAHHAAALRAYYTGVTGFHDHNFIELQFLDPLIPGYFWVFPLPNGSANVGVGMRSDYLKKKGLNLKKVLQQLIETHPSLKDRFKNATLEGKVDGYGLPLGSNMRSISGDHYMLLGDAGHLIDPLTGEGIGHGVYSGVYAAEQAAKCIEKQDFSSKFLKDYDKRIKRVLGKEMQLSYNLQRLLSNPKLVNFLANFIDRNAHLTELISRMYTDFELRSKLVKPGFWVKLLLFKKL
jgi:geranylgeranyl reductase family protein